MKNLLEEMKSVVANHPVTQHPFLKAFADGRLTLEQVRRWLEEQFYLSSSFSSTFAALYARIPDRFWKEKHELVGLFAVEAWGTNNPKAHSIYFAELARFLSIDLDVLTARAPKQYTKNYITARIDLCLSPNRPITQGLAAIALGEILNLHICEAYKEGIHKIAGLEKCPTGFFDAHIRDEVGDFKVFQSLFDAVARGEDDLRNAEIGVQELFGQRVIFLDRLAEDLGI